MAEITVRAAPEQIDAVMDFVNRQLDVLSCPEETRVDLDVAVDELLSNIIRYAYGPGTGTVTVRVETQLEPKALILTFLDQGAPFDPLAEERPDTTSLPARERPMGGLGLYLVRSLVDEITYARRDGQNVLTVHKEIGQGGTKPWQSP